MNRDVVKEYRGEVEFFCKSIRYIINYLDSVYSLEDIKNDLWVLVFETVRDYGEAVNIFLLRKRFRNHLIRLLRGSIVRIKVMPNVRKEKVKTSSESNYDWNESALGYNDNIILEALNSSTISGPHEVFDGHELLRLIVSWVSTQDDNSKRIINETLVPSPYVLEKWEEIASKTRMYTNYKSVPAPIVAKILGIKFRDYTKIMNNLKRFLRVRGYKI